MSRSAAYRRGDTEFVYNTAFQYLLTRGIAILDLNFRGSTGYGKRYTRLDKGRLRPNAVKDMAGALDWLATTGKVDASRAAVMGGSYGGYMTFAAVATLPDRFKAGVGFVGVSNWITALEGASPQLKASDRLEYGDIDNPSDREFFEFISPITHVRNVKAPLMVLHGANDPRDPVGEADQLVRAIRQQGGEVEYLRFPDEGHGHPEALESDHCLSARGRAPRTHIDEIARSQPSRPARASRLAAAERGGNVTMLWQEYAASHHPPGPGPCEGGLHGPRRASPDAHRVVSRSVAGIAAFLTRVGTRSRRIRPL